MLEHVTSIDFWMGSVDAQLAGRPLDRQPPDDRQMMCKLPISSESLADRTTMI